MKIALPFVLLLVIGCSPKQIPLESDFYGIDFTAYSARGFLITPERYVGKYESVGLVTYVLMPAARYNKEYLDWDVQHVNLGQAMDSLYARATAMGADALVNFATTERSKTHQIRFSGQITIVGYEVSGFAIKRKD